MVKIITYGTFDTFHYGHLEILRKSKELGDFLIVAVSTDGFNTLKGKLCKFPYEKRKQWVESIRYVDLVIPEESWEQKNSDVEQYDIDILTMGDDWQGRFDHLPCQVIYFPRTVDVSSTLIKNALTKKE